MREAGLTQEQLSKGNMLKIFGLTFIYSLLIATMMMPIVIHQFGAMGTIGGGAPMSFSQNLILNSCQNMERLTELSNMALSTDAC